jgi:hypothetical protein
MSLKTIAAAFSSGGRPLASGWAISKLTNRLGQCTAGAALALAAGLSVLLLVGSVPFPFQGQALHKDTKVVPVKKHSEEVKQQVLDAYGTLPLSFTPNAGQADPRVRYYAQGPGYSFQFTPTEAALTLVKKNHGTALALSFLGASPDALLEGNRKLPGIVNYLIGDDPARWRTEIPTYEQVVYHDLWPGVDLAFQGGNGQLKYEFLVQPGARVEDIRLVYSGSEGISLDREGNLLVRTPVGLLRDTRPVSYQSIGGSREPVESRFVLNGNGDSAFGFGLENYERHLPLVIDPGLAYSTFLGGSLLESGLGVAVDGSGNAYVSGDTSSSNFPTTPGSFDTTFNGSFADAFVSKLNPTGSALVYSTYLGGSSDDLGRGVTVDTAGSAYVSGSTRSSNFPTTPGSFDTTFNGGMGIGSGDGFVTKLNATGSALLYSTYLGGSSDDLGRAVTVDSAGSAYVTGQTVSSNFPTTPGAFDTTFNGSGDSFVSKLDAAGSALLFSTYLGGSSGDRGFGVAVETGGTAYVTGDTFSSNFPTTPGAFDTTFNGPPSVSMDAFVAKLNTTGSALLYSTYLGGSSNEISFGVALDSSGSAYAAGRTGSSNFPTTPGAFDTTFAGTNDAFVAKLTTTGSALLFSTLLGGSSVETALGVAVDSSGSAYVTGSTGSSDFPTTPGAFDTTANGGGDAFVTRINASGSALLDSTYLGGSNGESGLGIAVDTSGGAYVTGETFSFNFPTTPGAFRTIRSGERDAFVTKLDTAGGPATLTLSPKTDTNTVGTPHTVTATVKDVAGNPVSGVTVRFSVSGANSASGSDVTDANGEATFTYTGTTAGTDTISAFADTDNDGTQDPGEPSDIATKTWTPGAPATLTLAPPADSNTVGTTHCVTATVKDAFGNPVPGVTVRFSVPTATATDASPSSSSATTDANGEATFCYTASLPGEDTIHAFADSNNDGDQDPGEPFGDATKTWTPPPSTAFCEVTITEGGSIVANNGDLATFGGIAQVSGDGLTVQGQQEYQDHGPAQPRNVHSIELTATTCSDDLTTAAIFGTATIDGSGSFVFRIDVIDQGEPGTSDAYGIILSDGYASGQQQLQGGDVQIHMP